MIYAARDALGRMVNDDSRRVSYAARDALGIERPSTTPVPIPSPARPSQQDAPQSKPKIDGEQAAQTQALASSEPNQQIPAIPSPSPPEQATQTIIDRRWLQQGFALLALATGLLGALDARHVINPYTNHISAFTLLAATTIIMLVLAFANFGQHKPQPLFALYIASAIGWASTEILFTTHEFAGFGTEPSAVALLFSAILTIIATALTFRSNLTPAGD